MTIPMVPDVLLGKWASVAPSPLPGPETVLPLCRRTGKSDCRIELRLNRMGTDSWPPSYQIAGNASIVAYPNTNDDFMSSSATIAEPAYGRVRVWSYNRVRSADRAN